MITFQTPLQSENFCYTQYFFNAADDCNLKLHSHASCLIDESKPRNRLYERFDRSIGLQEKHPFYVLGEKLRPILDLVFNPRKTLWKSLTQTLGIIDKVTNSFFPFFPGAEACEIAENGSEKKCVVAELTHMTGFGLFNSGHPLKVDQLIIPVTVRCKSLFQLRKNWTESENIPCIDHVSVSINGSVATPIASDPITDFSMVSNSSLIKKSSFLFHTYMMNFYFKQIQTDIVGGLMKFNVKIEEDCLQIFADKCPWYIPWCTSCENKQLQFTKKTRREWFYLNIPSTKACEIAENGSEKKCAVAEIPRVAGLAVRNNQTGVDRLTIPITVHCKSLFQLKKNWTENKKMPCIDHVSKKVPCIDHVSVSINGSLATSISSRPIIDFSKLSNSSFAETNPFLFNTYVINADLRQNQTAKIGRLLRGYLEIEEDCLQVFADPCYEHQECTCQNIQLNFTKRTRTEPFYLTVSSNHP